MLRDPEDSTNEKLVGVAGQLDQTNESGSKKRLRSKRAQKNPYSLLDPGGLLMKAASARGSAATDAFVRLQRRVSRLHRNPQDSEKL